MDTPLTSNLNDIFAYIDEHSQMFLARLIEYLRRPSISAYGEGISEVADYVAGVMRQMGLVVWVMPTSGWPMVLGEYNAGRGSTTFGREFKEKIWGDLGHWEITALEWDLARFGGGGDKVSPHHDLEREPSGGRIDHHDVSDRGQTDQGGHEGRGKPAGAPATSGKVVHGRQVFLSS